MDLLNSHATVLGAIDAFGLEHGAALPDDLRTKLIAAQASGSPVDRMIFVAETLYANRASISDSTAKSAAMTLAGQVAAWCANPANAFHGFAAAGPDGAVARGVGICLAMQRELGETAQSGTTWPDPSTDPAPSSAWTVSA